MFPEVASLPLGVYPEEVCWNRSTAPHPTASRHKPGDPHVSLAAMMWPPAGRRPGTHNPRNRQPAHPQCRGRSSRRQFDIPSCPRSSFADQRYLCDPWRTAYGAFCRHKSLVAFSQMMSLLGVASKQGKRHMTQTAAGASLLNIARDAGCTPYDMLTGDPTTTKLARLRMPGGTPIAIQINNKTPRIWLSAEHDTGALSVLGRRENYPAGRGRHHHLDQIREFRDRPLVKIEVSTSSWPEIRAAFAAACALPAHPRPKS